MLSGAIAPLAGCLGNDTNGSDPNSTMDAGIGDTTTETVATTPPEPALVLSDIRAIRGESGVFTIRAEHVRSVHLPSPLNESHASTATGSDTSTANDSSEPPMFDYENVSTAPPVSVIYLGETPEYRWESIKDSVVVEVPYTVPEGSPTETYDFRIVASQSENGSGPGRVSQSVSFTVKES